VIRPLLAVGIAFMLVGCGSGTNGKNAGSEKGLTDLHSVSQLTAAFNHAAGKPRLVVLMSPT
jgi:hypothetical protein